MKIRVFLGFFFFSVIFLFSQDKCEHVVLREMLNIKHLGYGQEHKKLFFIKNFIEADFFSHYDQIQILISFHDKCWRNLHSEIPLNAGC